MDKKSNPYPGIYEDANNIITFSGKQIDITKGPTPEQVDINDIAHALAHTCRFGGHTKKFYSVAEHSIYVALHGTMLWRVYYLLHDAHEYLYQDIVSPLKTYLGTFNSVYEGLVFKCDQAVLKAFNLSMDAYTNLKPEIDLIDRRVLRLEIERLIPGHTKEPSRLPDDDPLKEAVWGMTPDEAETNYLAMFKNLMQ